MAKFSFCVSTGYVGSEKSDVIEIPDEELEGKTEDERDELIGKVYEEWLWENINAWFQEVE